MDMPAYRESTRRQAIVQKYLVYKKEDDLKSLKEPTDAEIMDQYNLHRSQFIRPDTVQFSFILVPFGPDAASKTKAKELIDKLYREIGSSTNQFEEVVRKGQVPNAGYQAGDKRYIYRNPDSVRDAGQAFFDASFSLKQGEISKVIEGVPGYWIIRMTEFLPQKNLELDDVYNLGSRQLMSVKQFIGGNLSQMKAQEALVKASQELATELRKGSFSGGNSFRINENALNW
jgi:parvulin-like peptidyl-prolyl isomerase